MWAAHRTALSGITCRPTGASRTKRQSSEAHISNHIYLPAHTRGEKVHTHGGLAGSTLRDASGRHRRAYIGPAAQAHLNAKSEYTADSSGSKRAGGGEQLTAIRVMRVWRRWFDSLAFSCEGVGRLCTQGAKGSVGCRDMRMLRMSYYCIACGSRRRVERT